MSLHHKLSDFVSTLRSKFSYCIVENIKGQPTNFDHIFREPSPVENVNETSDIVVGMFLVAQSVQHDKSESFLVPHLAAAKQRPQFLDMTLQTLN